MIENFQEYRRIIARGHPLSARVDSWFEGLDHPCAGKCAGEKTPDIEIVYIRDVKLYVDRGGFAIINKKNEIITAKSSKDMKKFSEGLKSLPEKKHVGAIFFNGDPHHGNNTNYCIWLVDNMPRICWAKELFPNMAIALHAHGLNSFQEQSLVAAGVSIDSVTSLMSGQYTVDELAFLTSSSESYVSRLQGGNREYAVPLLGRLRIPPVKQERKIFVTRPPGMRRTIIDYDIVIEKLIGRGFEIINPGLFDFYEQRRIFSEASHVVGVHGAGLANILFCAPDTKVMEIFPKNYGTRAFVWIGDVVDLDYRVHVADAPGPKPLTWLEAFHQDVVMDTAQFWSSLDAFLK